MGAELVEAKEIVIRHGKAMAVELIEKVAIDALKDAVQKSATPIDDVVVAALAEPLKKAIIDAIQKA